MPSNCPPPENAAESGGVKVGHVDLLGSAPNLDEALSELKEAAAVDLGDFIELPGARRARGP